MKQIAHRWTDALPAEERKRRGYVELEIDTSGVPEDKRDAKFEEELAQFEMYLCMNESRNTWLFRVACHEGAHLRYLRKVGRECTPKGPRLVYRDRGDGVGEFLRIDGSILWEPTKDYSPDFTMGVLKGYLAGPLAITMLTGEQADAEPDILNACEVLEASRDTVEGWIWVAEPELEEELRNPVIVAEILDCAREYANTVFGNDACIDWGIRRYRLDALAVKVQEAR